MIQTNQPCDPRVHLTSIAIAERFLHTIRACLREEEWGDALREFYFVIREEIEAARSISEARTRSGGISRRCVYIVEACVREDERGDLVQVFQLIAKEELERAHT
jgi:hypothetical protein